MSRAVAMPGPYPISAAVHVTDTIRRQGGVEKSAYVVRKALANGVSGSPRTQMGGASFPSWRCVVLDVALVALTIAVFAVLALILKGLERL